MPQHAVPHEEYELVFQALGTVNEVGGHQLRLSGKVRVIQGPKQLNVNTLDDATMVYAFLSVNDMNLPLLPNQRARWVAPLVYEIHIPGREFSVALDQSTSDELIVEFEKILRWFCKYDTPTQAAPGSPAAAAGSSFARRLDRAGDSCVAFVERVGGRMQGGVTTRVDAQVDAARGTPTRNVPLGGRATAGVMGGTRRAVGAGASLASKVTDRASDVVGSVLGSNPIMKSLGNAPEASKRFRFHDTLTSGMVAIGKVYVAADEKGRSIVSTTGEGGAEILRERYGEEVAGAARNGTGIAVDGYRIMRFPAKFGASSLIKGAMKAGARQSANNGSR